MINIAVIFNKKDMINKIKNELRLSFKKDVYVESLPDIESLLESRTVYQFCIIDLETYGIIDNHMKYTRKLYYTYYIYYAYDYSQCYKVIGYNVIGFLMYNQVNCLSNSILDYLKWISLYYNCYFKTEEGYVNFNYNEIIFFELNNRKIMLQTIYKKYYLVNYSLNQIKDILNDNFILINRSVIINQRYIKKIDLNNILTIKYRNIKCSFNLSTRKRKEINLSKKRYHLNKNDIKLLD